MTKILAVFCAFIVGIIAQASPSALVYKGPGACGSCSESAFLMATKAGLEAKFIGPKETDPSLFKNIKVYIQPGGTSLDVAKNMSSNLKLMIQKFIKAGGGYIGFCAGAFFSTEEIRDEGVLGLGILPGRSWLWLGVPDAPAIVQIRWGEQSREMYWEGGPYLDFSKVDQSKQPVEVIATYNDGKVAAARTTYGLGRVFVSGVHPESPQAWRDNSGLIDRDGLDWDLAIQMIKWSENMQQ